MQLGKYSSMVEAVIVNAKNVPDRLCIAGEKALSYALFSQRIFGVADYLHKIGVNKNDNVVLKSAQSADYLISLFAIHLIGAIAVPLEKNCKADRASEIISLTDAKFYISDSEIDNVKNISYSELAELVSTENHFELPKSEDYSTILFTTGTTGKSKGILLTHFADVSVAENVAQAIDRKEDNVEIIPMPLNHSFALRRFYANILHATAVILLDGVVFVAKFFEAFDKYGATSVAIAPSAISIIFKLSGDKLGEYADRITYIQFGSAHLPEPEKNKLLELIPNSHLYNIYGSTEAGCATVLDFTTSDNKPNCIGRPTINSIIKFIDDDGNFVETDESHPAKMVSGGKMLMSEYYQEPELTAETVIDGFVHSNDLGYMDENGLLFVIGRADDVIICGGQKIAPSEVEDVALEYNGIAESVVVGQDDKLMGQVPKMFIVVNDNYNEKEFIDFLNERLESFNVPKIIKQINEIPKTFNGKPLRRKLKDM